MAFIGLLNKEFNSITELEKFLDYCRCEYVEQVTDFTDLSIEDTLGIYACLAIKEKSVDKLKNK